MFRSGTLQTFGVEQQINIKEMDDRTALYHSGSNYFAQRGCSLEKQEAKWYEQETLHNRRYFKWNEKCPWFLARNIWSSGRICMHQMETRHSLKNHLTIDHFKVTAAILPGVQIFWGERAAKHKMQIVD